MEFFFEGSGRSGYISVLEKRFFVDLAKIWLTDEELLIMKLVNFEPLNPNATIFRRLTKYKFTLVNLIH